MVQEEAATRASLRNLIVGIVIVVVLVVIFMRGSQLMELAEMMSRGTPVFLALAIAAQMGNYWAQGLGYRSCFRVVDEKIPFTSGLSMVFSALFVNTLVPSMNMAGRSLVVGIAYGRHGVSPGKATTAMLLMQICLSLGFVLIMLITFFVLSLTIGLRSVWLVLGLIVIVRVGGLALIMVFGSLKPDFVKRVARPFVKRIDQFRERHNRAPIEERFNDIVTSFSDASKLIAHRPKRALLAFVRALIATVCEMGCFVLSGLAFGIYDPAALVCSYVVATLFSTVPFVPQGVGIVEAATLASFGLFGIDGTAGLAAILVYRGFVFWIPFIIGAFVVQMVGRRYGVGFFTRDDENNGIRPIAADKVAQSGDAADGGAHGERATDGDVQDGGGPDAGGGGAGASAPGAGSGESVADDVGKRDGGVENAEEAAAAADIVLEAEVVNEPSNNDASTS